MKWIWRVYKEGRDKKGYVEEGIEIEEREKEAERGEIVMLNMARGGEKL